MTRLKRVLVSVVAVGLCMLPSVISTTAAADGQDLGNESTENLTAGETANNQVERFVSALDRFADAPGFGKVVVDYSARSVKMFWKGTPPTALADLEESIDPTFELLPSEYSFAELDAAGRQLLAEDADGGADITSTMPNVDLSGLAVTVSNSDSRLATRSSKRLLRRSLSRAAQVPVTRVSNGGGVGEWTRQNDSAPWQGGGGMTSNAGSCTVGFSVVRNGIGYLLSAAHCDPGGEADVRDASGQIISDGGAAVQSQNTNDTMLIDPRDGTIGEVYGGPWNAGTGHNRYEFQVVNKSLPAEGTPVCTSGANTGEHCNVVIHRTGVNRDCGPNLAFNCHGFVVRNTTGFIVGGPGDSGAPVYYDRGNGTVGARGILIGPTLDEDGNQTYAQPCPNDIWLTQVNTGCGSRGFVIGYHTIENTWNVDIEFE